MSNSAETQDHTIDFDSIIDYQKTVKQLIQDLDNLLGYSEELKLNESAELIQQALKRLKESIFTVAVVGEFKIGKSTFLNALLGSGILPMDVVPATAAINRVTYSLDNRIVVNFKDGRKEEVGINDLAKYVTKIQDPLAELAKTVKEAVVYHNAPFLMNNVDIIDTPGLNEDAIMDEVTFTVLPSVDAAILLISATAPFSDTTRAFLENKLLMSDLGRVIFVVNQIGRLSSEEADRIIQYIENAIKQRVIERAKSEYGEESPEYEVYIKKIGRPKVFGVDSYWGLEGRKNNDAALIEKSRFQNFMPALEKFLTKDRGVIILQIPINRIIASANEILSTLGGCRTIKLAA